MLHKNALESFFRFILVLMHVYIHLIQGFFVCLCVCVFVSHFRYRHNHNWDPMHIYIYTCSLVHGALIKIPSKCNAFSISMEQRITHKQTNKNWCRRWRELWINLEIEHIKTSNALLWILTFRVIFDSYIHCYYYSTLHAHSIDYFRIR